MRMHRNGMLIAMAGAALMAAAAPMEGGLSNREREDLRRRRARETAVPLPPAEPNRPGETNRQFAARMKAEAQS